ncbi:expressed unknown protein [Seminavis robusta]|uniref:Uncharacterized protein n=1 Tax=Seminavis robusta TaxID=568900 RepID=A0A9N8EAM3_9STRA|nr:expressed unknown protein [Seminavis robusta]|eukprot:Sro810_g205710.1 n/a (187) ;mRNA; r:10809-11369
MNSQALNTTGETLFCLYDNQALLAMDSKVASGYIVLMGGYPKTPKKKRKKKNKKNEESEENEEAVPKLDRGAINLAFMALTDGNVVDACFGVKTHSAAGTAGSRAAKMAADAKELLNEAVRSSGAVREIAVTAYGKAFQIVLQYNQDIKHLNFITRCYRWKPIHQEAEESLFQAFRALNEAIDAAH